MPYRECGIQRMFPREDYRLKEPTMTIYTEYDVTILYNDHSLSTYTFRYRRKAIDFGETIVNGEGDAVDYKIKKKTFSSDVGYQSKARRDYDKRDAERESRP